MYRYMEVLETLYDEIVTDIKSETFTVSDKYKTKNEELGNN